MGYMTDLKKAQDDNNVEEVLRLQGEYRERKEEERRDELLKKHNGLTMGQYAKGKTNNFKNVDKEFFGELFDEEYCDVVSGDDYIFYLNEYNGKIEFDDVICFHAEETIILYNKKTHQFKEEVTR